MFTFFYFARIFTKFWQFYIKLVLNYDVIKFPSASKLNASKDNLT